MITIGDQNTWYSHPTEYYVAIKNKKIIKCNGIAKRQKRSLKEYLAVTPNLCVSL